ncbi:MAG: NBR1-Ig-like domain-containing protein, partial [Chloroflexota bacterium]
TPNGRFLRDVTIPDDSLITTNAPFIKTWSVENTGDTTWNQNYRVVNVGGHPMTNTTSQTMPEARPGDQVDLSVNLVAPNTPGTHFSDWRLQDDKGNQFGDIIYTRIIAEPPFVQPGGVSNGKFVADVTIPDDTVIQPGAKFTKTWCV